MYVGAERPITMGIASPDSAKHGDFSVTVADCAAHHA